MRPRPDLRLKPYDRRRWLDALGRPAALSMVALLLALGPEDALAQQGWPAASPISPYYGPSQSSPYAQPQGYAQQPYQQAPYPQQSYPQAPYGQQQADLPDPGADQGGYAPAPPQGQPLDAARLEQLVAPIALYPDALVAQILAAATYPAQVAAADRWRQAQAYASPDQIAGAADVQNWDPSVKALTAFPQVLAQMDQNLQWTTELGNAYYNQPQDVLQVIQVMRQRAEAAGNLQSTPQEQVTNDQGYIGLAPANPQVVYVPAYNPWTAYGAPVSPYPGFSLIGALGSLLGSTFGSTGLHYGMGIALGAFASTPWGWLAWGLNWLAHSVFFQHSTYYSRSTTVVHWNGGRGYPGRGYEARGNGVYGRSGGYSYGQGFNRPQNGYRPENGYYGGRPAEAYPRDYRSPGNAYARPPQEAYTRMPAPARPQQYATPQFGRPGYGSSFAARPQENYANRSTPNFGARGGFNDRANQRAFAAPAKPSGSGGFHLFGSGHSNGEFSGGGHAPKAPKDFGGGGKHGGGGGGHSGGHGGGGHHH